MKTNPSAFSGPLSFFAVTGLLVLVSLSPSAACAQAADVPVVVPAPVPGGVRVVAPAGSATVANAQVVSANGIVDVYEPGTRVVVKETTGPVTYTYGPQVVYATPGGDGLNCGAGEDADACGAAHTRGVCDAGGQPGGEEGGD